MNAGCAPAKSSQQEEVMKKLIRNALWMVFATAVIALSTASAARAQTNVDVELVTKVPFAFVVGDVRLPAGDYVVKEMGDGVAFAIESPDGRAIVLTQTAASPAEGSESQPGLGFKKYGDVYFLARISPRDGVAREIELRPSDIQQELVEARKSAN
jgi:hypothetical protein